MFTATDNRTYSVYRNIISLGATCQPAWHLRKNSLRLASYPLDWINSRRADSVCSLLKNGFADFFEKSCLRPIEGDNCHNRIRLRHSTYGFVFRHEFEGRPDFEERFEHRQSVYHRRIARLLKLLNSDTTVLFVRFRVTGAEARQIALTLRGEFPALKFTLLALDDTDEIREDWAIPDVVNRYIDCAPDNDATSPDYDHNWTDLFGEFTIRAEIPSRLARLFRRRKLSFLD